MRIQTIGALSLFLAFGLLFGTDAHAADAILKGTIKVAGAKTAPIAPLKCDGVGVAVTSKEQTSAPPGFKGVWLPTPKWQRGARATGSWASGSCSYSIKVVPNSEFDVVLQAAEGSGCGGYDVVSSTPAQAGWFKVSKGDTKEQNFKLDSIYCQEVP